jgi:predicted transcriptional regulator
MNKVIKIKTEQKVYNAFVKLEKENCYPPTLRELCIECSYKSRGCMQRYINILVEKGLIEKIKKGVNKKRNYRTVKKNVGYKNV